MIDTETDRKPIPAYVVQAAIADQKEHDEYAIVRSDGDYEYARTMAEAYNVEADMQSAIDHVAPIGHSVAIVDLSGMDETPFDRWYTRASKNVKKWGLQDLETLLLATQEELGELTQAVLESRHEDGDPDRIQTELNDLAALVYQMQWRLEERDSE